MSDNVTIFAALVSVLVLMLLATLCGYWVGTRSRLDHPDYLRAKLSEILGARNIRPDEVEATVDMLDQESLQLTNLLDRQLTGFRNMAGNIAHEMAVPVGNLIDRFDKIDPQDSDFSHSFDLLGDRLRDLQLMFNALLDIVTLETDRTVTMAETDLRDIALESLLLFEDAAEEKAVRLDTELESAMILGNYWLLMQALNNLISNAIRFCPSDSTVRLTVSNQQGRATLIIKDSGPGITQNSLDELLADLAGPSPDPDEGFHHGLGLRMVRATMMRHGAKILIEKPQEAGLQYRISFPRYENTDADISG